VVQHVNVLEASELVRSQKVGRIRRTRSADQTALWSAESWIALLRTLIERRLDRLRDYLDQTADHPDADGAEARRISLTWNSRALSRNL
jgi:hypothetical protein